jgi:outer membrane protein assembly factor BamA
MWMLLPAFFSSLLVAQDQTPPNKPPATEMPATPPNTAQMLASYEGQNVSSVVLAGHPDLDFEHFEPVMTQKANQPFSAANVDETARALKAAGHFEDVRVEVLPDARGVIVYFILEPGFWYGIFTFPGADRFPYSQLLQAANYPPQMPYSVEEVEKDRADLQSFLQEQGYFQAKVTSQVNVDKNNALVNIAFHVLLDRKARFGSAIIQGAPNEENLTAKLTGVKARARGAAIRPGKTYRRGNIDRAARYLQSLLAKQGYLGAQVKLEGAEYNPNTNRADIRFSIEPDVVTHVDIKGAHVWSWTKKDLLPIYQGVGVDDETVQEGQQALVSYFQSKGYFDVKVSSDLKKDHNGATVTYQITKEKKRKVASVDFAGNSQLPASQLEPTTAVRKKHFLSPGTFSNDLLRKSVSNLTSYYKSEGFSEVKVTPSVVNRGKDVAVTFTVAEGPRDIVDSVAIEGDPTLSQSQYAPQGLRVRAGQPYSATRAQEDRSTILASYLRAGYLNATFRETASQVSTQEPHRIHVVYQIFEGPRVITRDVLTLGRASTSQRVIQNRVSALQPGKPLTEQDLLASGSRLYDLTGVFDWAEVAPKREVTTQTKEDVLVKLHEARRNEIQYGFGFEVVQRGGSIPSGTVALPSLPPIGLPPNFTTNEATFYGPRGTVQYTRNNLRGRGESMTLTGFAGRLDQRFAFYYINPSFRWSSWKSTTQASYERNEQNPVFSAQIETASVQLQRAIDHAQKNIVYFRYSFNKTDLTHVLVEGLVPEQDQHIHLSTFAANFTRDTRDNPLDEHSGVLDSLELDFDSTKLGSSVDFVKLTGQAAYYKQIIHRIVWSNSIRIGLAQPFNGSFVPLSEAFFTGGANSLRGFPLNGAGPQRPVEVCPNGASGCNVFIQVPTGGNSLLILNSEARIPLDFIKKNLGLALFYDGGGVFPRVGFHSFTELYSNNVGFGLRYSTPLGPIRIDIGRNLNPVPGIKPTQYFITLGQAF